MSNQIQYDRLANVPAAELFKAFMSQINEGEAGTKAQTTGAPVGPYLHGPGGTFSTLGLDVPIISTHTNITSSLAASLPVQTASMRVGSGGELEPLAAYITGFVRSDQQDKDGVCDDPEPAGNMKTCILTTRFGRKEFATRQVEVNRIGQTNRRGEFMDQRLVNTPLVNNLAGIFQQNFGFNNPTSFMAADEMQIRLLEVAVAYQRWFCPTTYTGNPTNNSAGGGYKEFPGLDLLIGTNKIDAVSGTTCPSLYSTIRDFAYNDVQDVNAANNMIRLMKSLLRYINRKAEQQNMDTLDLALVMRSNLFDALVDVWPCGYATDRCQTQETNAGLRVTINDLNNPELRDDMRNGRYLLVDGRRVRVILDDCITEEEATDNASVPNGAYSSDIYIVPLSARGGSVRTMWWEYYDYRQGTMPAVQDARAGVFFWSDAGRFMWSVKSPDNWCLEMISKVEPRLRLATPQFAARITNVVYVPDYGLHYDDPLPSQDYWLNGGNPSGYPEPSPYSEWNTDGPGGW
jgi:hypothetical protein